jgi:hypothetical protein
MADEQSEPTPRPERAPTGAGTQATPSGGDRTATRASDLTDDPDPGGGSGLDSRGDIASDMTAEPPVDAG